MLCLPEGGRGPTETLLRPLAVLSMSAKIVGSIPARTDGPLSRVWGSSLAWNPGSRCGAAGATRFHSSPNKGCIVSGTKNFADMIGIIYSAKKNKPNR